MEYDMAMEHDPPLPTKETHGVLPMLAVPQMVLRRYQLRPSVVTGGHKKQVGGPDYPML